MLFDNLAIGDVFQTQAINLLGGTERQFNYRKVSKTQAVFMGVEGESDHVVGFMSSRIGRKVKMTGKKVTKGT